MGCGSSVPAAADGNTVQITKINDAESAYDAADKTVTKMKATAGMRIRKVTLTEEERKDYLIDLFEVVDADGDGSVTKEEFSKLYNDVVDEKVEEAFAAQDTEVQDGVLDQSEFVNYHMKKFAEWDDETFDVVINRLMLKFKRYSRASARMSTA